MPASFLNGIQQTKLEKPKGGKIRYSPIGQFIQVEVWDYFKAKVLKSKADQVGFFHGTKNILVPEQLEG